MARPRKKTKRAEEALAECVATGGARGLCKLGLAVRNDAARRRIEAALFQNTDRRRQQRASMTNRVESPRLALPKDGEENEPSASSTAERMDASEMKASGAEAEAAS